MNLDDMARRLPAFLVPFVFVLDPQGVRGGEGELVGPDDARHGVCRESSDGGSTPGGTLRRIGSTDWPAAGAACIASCNWTRVARATSSRSR